MKREKAPAIESRACDPPARPARPARRATGLSAAGAALGAAIALAQASKAADLDTNLVVNGGFEDVDRDHSIAYGNSEILTGWTTDFGDSVFAYNYAQSYDDRNDDNEVPPGNDSASDTDYYFSMNGVDTPGVQTIDLSGGASGAAIASGAAEYDLSAFFTNYLSDEEGGQLTLEFYDGDPGLDGTEADLIGEPVSFTDPNIDEWTEIGGSGAIHPSVKWVRILLDKNPDTGLSGGPDVYVDNVSFVVKTKGGDSLVQFTGISLSAEGVSLTWQSAEEVTYSLEFTTDFVTWREINDSIPSGGSQTTFLVTGEEADGPAGYFRVFPASG